nr:hypothetical protein [Tepidiforma sp.]
MLIEVETLEGDALVRLLNSDPDEPWPPPDMAQSRSRKRRRSRPPTRRRAAPFEPKPATGLAWEAGNQARTDGGRRADPQRARGMDAAPASLTGPGADATLEEPPRQIREY